MTHIIKRRGHREEFDERKLYASVFAACLSAHVKHEEAESIASLVCREVKKWLSEKDEVTSDQIFKQAGEELKHLNKESSFMYLTHRDIS
ncbi:hypothetical protein HYZ06_02150 [Candidatus Daviesbacteria bacterium]|nr:hypothetical protein [Candidatus Daviesbacteria bacterium]